jgi:type IV secretion system protein TrbG
MKPYSISLKSLKSLKFPSKLHKFATIFIAICTINTMAISHSMAQNAGQISNRNPQPISQARTATATPLAIDSRVVEFPFDKNGIFEIRTKLDNFTRLTFSEGETMRGFYLSDSVSWEHHVASDKQNVFIKPKVPGVTTTATLITNKRTYDLDFKTVEGAGWHQRASWAADPNAGYAPTAPSTSLRFYEAPVVAVTAAAPAAVALAEPKSPVPCDQAGSSKRYRYTAAGDPQFIPVKAWDDGVFTCLQMPTNFQDLPALFVLDREGNAEIADHKLRENMIIVPRVMEFGGLLKLGKAEVIIKNVDDKSARNPAWTRPGNVGTSAGSAGGSNDRGG